MTDAPGLGGLKQRSLLALLLLRAGETVPRDVLVEEVWGETPPASAAHAVEVYVSQLRKALAPTAAAIESAAGGYRLAVDPDEIDAHVFARLAGEGRLALAADDAAGAAAVLDRALALWRGPALADFRYEAFAQTEIARLDELRRAAAEDRAEALLALGRHGELAAELEQMVDAEPLRERRRRLLMLALYRSGRQADALAAYRDAARTLREELGLEPGPELRELEAAMLAQDPRIAAPGAKVSLPSPATELIGRGPEAEDVAALLRGAARIVTLTGAGGIGKTRLALEAASRLAGRFPGGVVFVDLAPLESDELVLPTIAEAVAVARADADPLGALIAEIGDVRMLLVLDNFEHVIDTASALGRLVSSCPGVRLLVTSRRALRLYGEHEYEVPPLAEADAIALFRARGSARRRALPSDPQADAAIAEICRRLDRLPLAIELAAAQSALLTPSEMLSRLPGSLELAARGPRDVPVRQQTLRAAIEWSHDLLDDEAAAVFRRLGAFAGGWDLDAASAVALAAAEELGRLADHSLVFRDPGGGRFRMLTTIRDYAVELLDGSGEDDAVRRRHAEHYLALADQGDARLRAGGDQADALDRLEAEHDNLRAALGWASQADPALELRLAGALASFCAVRGHLEEGRQQLEAALARAAGEDEAAIARALAGLGVIVRTQTDHAAARPLLERSAALYRGLGDPSGLVRALANLGFAQLALGERDAALACYEEALATARASGNHRDHALMLNCLADLELREARFERVEELSREALVLAEQVADAEAVAVSLMNRAHAAFGARRMQDALEAGRESLRAWAAIGDETSAAWSIDVLAAVVAADAPEAAACLIGAADEARRRAGCGLDAFELEIHAHAEREARERLTAETYERARQEGGALRFDETVARALEVVAAG